jgi:hypothetical protein
MSHISQITHFVDQPEAGFQTYHRTHDFTSPLPAVAPTIVDVLVAVTRKKKKEKTK